MPFGFIHDHYVPTECKTNQWFSLDLVLIRIEFVAIETCVL
jgi:hypothetical protein